MEGLNGASSATSGGFENDRRSQSITLFVDNLPERMDNHWLRNMFKWYGDIADVFVPWRRRKGYYCRYGFVGFFKEKDADLAISKANGAWCCNRRISVKRAAFRNPRSNPHSGKFNKRAATKIWRRKDAPLVPSRVEVQSRKPNDKGKGPMFPSQAQADLKHVRNAIEVIQAAETDEVWLHTCMVGKVANFNSLSGLQEAIIRKGVFYITMRFLGGLLVLVEFQSEEVMSWYLEQKSWLAQWFSELSKWKPSLQLTDRLVWLNISGVPLHFWTVANFNRIGERFGCVISIDRNTSTKKVLDRGKILVSTKFREPISKELLLEFLEERFLITVKEESGVSFSLHSLHAVPPSRQHGNGAHMVTDSVEDNCEVSSSSS
ncbi:hypothetical protein L1049_022713 [Liquidambar formosana]|uniref:RRM domain-containing protein n=1 Tax=Liquidambar formosana TaxID=63359 RepID=A0AAP0REA0_LIQFO